MFYISNFSQFAQVSAHLLRHYNEIGLLWSGFLALGEMLPERRKQRRFVQCTSAIVSSGNKHEQAQARVEASDHNWRLLAETMPQLVWTTQPDGRVDYINQRFCDLTQARDEQLHDFGWHQFVHPADYEETLALRERSLATGELYESAYRLKDGRTGNYRWFLARAYPMRDNAGRITKWFGTGTDIDELKRVQHALLQSQERERAFMASTIMGIFTAREETIIEANEAFLRMTGYNQEDVDQGRVNWFQMTAPEYIARTQQEHQRLDQYHSMPAYEKEYLCKDGRYLPVLVGGIITNPDAQEMLCFVLDNTARKEVEQRKGGFLNIASHELRTPLTAVKLQTQLIQRRLKKQGQPQVAVEVQKVEEPIRLLERMIGELLDVSHLQAGTLQYLQEPVDLTELIHEAAAMMEQISLTHIIVIQCPGSLTLLGDKGRLAQAIMNLLSNAIKYSPAADSVEIEVTASADTITMCIHDYGLGIPQEQYEQIFEQFYRIDHQRQGNISGLGVGLYIVAEVVKHHGGTISVTSVVGEGSTFRLTFPRCIAASPIKCPPSEP